MRLIDADELKAYFQDGTEGYDFSHWTRFDIIDVIDNAPTIEELPKGKWSIDCQCSNCKKYVDYTTDFCQNCGADMRGDV